MSQSSNVLPSGKKVSPPAFFNIPLHSSSEEIWKWNLYQNDSIARDDSFVEYFFKYAFFTLAERIKESVLSSCFAQNHLNCFKTFWAKQFQVGFTAWRRKVKKKWLFRVKHAAARGYFSPWNGASAQFVGQEIPTPSVGMPNILTHALTMNKQHTAQVS